MHQTRCCRRELPLSNRCFQRAGHPQWNKPGWEVHLYEEQSLFGADPKVMVTVGEEIPDVGARPYFSLDVFERKI